MRIGRLLAVGAVILGGCSDADEADAPDEVRTIQITDALTGNAAVEADAIVPEFPTESPYRSLRFAIVDAPEEIEIEQLFTYIVELKNISEAAVRLEPCADFHGVFGESGTVTATHGRLPCEEIGELQPGEEVRLAIEMRGPDQPVIGEGGTVAALTWDIQGLSTTPPVRRPLVMS